MSVNTQGDEPSPPLILDAVPVASKSPTPSGPSASPSPSGPSVSPSPSPSGSSPTPTTVAGASLADPNRGNSLAVGDSVGVGQQLTSANGSYKLALNKKGNLVLSGPGNAQLWQSGTDDATGKVLWATFGSDGSINLRAAAQYQTMTKWSTQEGLTGLPSTAVLRLNDDGSLVVVDSAKPDSPALAIISVADSAKHYFRVQLYQPFGRPKALDELIETTQDWLQRAVDSLGVGKASELPDLSTLLSNAGIADTSDTGKLAEQYRAKVGEFAAIKTTLHGKDFDVSAAAGNIATETKDALARIKHMIEDLNEKLRAPQSAKGVSAEVTARPVDVKYDLQGDLTKAELNPLIADQLMGAVSDCYHNVEAVIDKVNEHVDAARREVEAKAEYERGRKEGLAGLDAAAAAATAAAAAAAARGNPVGPEKSVATPAAPDAATSEGAPTQQEMDALLGGDATNDNDKLIAAIDAATAKVEASGITPAPESSGPSVPVQAPAPTSAPRSAQAPAIAPTYAPTGGGQSGSGMEAMIMASAMKDLMADKSTTGEDNSRKRRKRKDPVTTEQAPGTTPAPGTAPAPGTEPASVTAPTDPQNPPPANGTKSMVDMKLPDGSTQKVSSVVAEAVNRELNNPNGSDARAAYKGGLGDASVQSPWNTTDRDHLRTGDVVQWGDRTALLVAAGGGWRIIVNGLLVSFDPRNPTGGAEGANGEFQYFHPSGADVDLTAQPVATQIQTVAGSPAPVA